LQLGAVDYLPKRLLTPERLKTSVRLALRMIEKRVARRIANLASTNDAGTRSVVLGASKAVQAAKNVTTAPKIASVVDAADPNDANGAASTDTPNSANANAQASPVPESADAEPKPSTSSSTPLPAAKAPGGEFMPADFIPG